MTPNQIHNANKKDLAKARKVLRILSHQYIDGNPRVNESQLATAVILVARFERAESASRSALLASLNILNIDESYCVKDERKEDRKGRLD